MYQKKNILALIFGLTMMNITYGQHYKTALGIRLGRQIGVTLQQNIGEKKTLEAIIAGSNNSPVVNIVALGERHFNFATRRMNLYAGLGPNVGILREKKVDYSNTFGVSLIGGAEITVKRLNFSVDFMPTANLLKGKSQDRFDSYIGLSARYVIVEREKLVARMKKKFKRKT